MDKQQYHHGTLKKDLIEKGLILLNKEGYEGLSLRKVASMCGVSHAAPYKHFKNKDELVSAISLEANNSFTATLEIAVELYPDNPQTQLVEMGKQYVRFMVENPDYLKFIFLSGTHCHIIVKNNEFHYEEAGSFHVFKKCAENYFDYIDLKDEDRSLAILSMWSMVHGIAILMVNNSIVYDGDYSDLVSKMILEKLKFK